MTDNRRVERKFVKEMKDGNSKYWRFYYCDYWDFYDDEFKEWIQQCEEQEKSKIKLANQWLEEQGTQYREHFPYIVELKQDKHDYMKWLNDYSMYKDYIIPIFDVMEESSCICFKDKNLAIMFKMRFQ